MKNKWTVLVVLFFAAVVGAVALVMIPAPEKINPTQNPASIPDLIVVTSPLPYSKISSKSITITGKARGSWFFEAQFPVELVPNEPGPGIIARGTAHADGDWMTNDFVPFTATLHYEEVPIKDISTTSAFIILKNDNPSGDPAREKKLEIPVVF